MIAWIAVFMLWIVVEYAYTRITVHIIGKNAPMAGFFSALIVGTMGLTTIGYVADPWLLVPSILGAASGTYLTVRYVQ